MGLSMALSSLPRGSLQYPFRDLEVDVDQDLQGFGSEISTPWVMVVPAT